MLWDPHGDRHQRPEFLSRRVEAAGVELRRLPSASKRVYLSPHLPFGWFDYPPGANRLIGLLWLSEILYPRALPARPEAREVAQFYRLFYHQEPTRGADRRAAGRARRRAAMILAARALSGSGSASRCCCWLAARRVELQRRALSRRAAATCCACCGRRSPARRAGSPRNVERSCCRCEPRAWPRRSPWARRSRRPARPTRTSSAIRSSRPTSSACPRAARSARASRVLSVAADRRDPGARVRGRPRSPWDSWSRSARGSAAAIRILTLVLTGVVVGSLFGAGIALVKYVADPYNQLPAITFWLLGSFTGALPRDLPATLLPIAHRPRAAGAPALAHRRARRSPRTRRAALGVDVGALRFVDHRRARRSPPPRPSRSPGPSAGSGLVIPHAARLLVGAAFARVLPLSLVLGAAFMLAVDTAVPHRLRAPRCRRAWSTAFVGTPVFIVLLAVSFRSAPMTLAARALDYRTSAATRGGPGVDLDARRRRSRLPARPERQRQDHAHAHAAGPARRRSAGDVTLDGREPRRWPARERATRLAYVPQAARELLRFQRARDGGDGPHRASRRLRAARRAGPRAVDARASSGWASRARRSPDPPRERRRAPARAHRARARHRGRATCSWTSPPRTSTSATRR